jgi:hypothetical protein
VAPLAVKFAAAPLQMVVLGETVTFIGVTVTVTVAVDEHDPVVPVTV